MGVLGVILIAAGAILRFAVTTTADGIDLGVVGVILMVVGGVAVLVSLTQGSFAGFRSRSRRQMSDDGRVVVEEHSSTGW
jgi:hypothetical protein